MAQSSSKPIPTPGVVRIISANSSKRKKVSMSNNTTSTFKLSSDFWKYQNQLQHEHWRETGTNKYSPRCDRGTTLCAGPSGATQHLADDAVGELRKYHDCCSTRAVYQATTSGQ